MFWQGGNVFLLLLPPATLLPPLDFPHKQGICNGLVAAWQQLFKIIFSLLEVKTVEDVWERDAAIVDAHIASTQVETLELGHRTT